MTDLSDIRNFLRLSDNITTSGRLLPGDPARLAAMGARRVINLALSSHGEALADAENAMAAAGLDYVHIPVPFGDPREEHCQAFKSALEASAEPVHVHCIMNWRVSAFFYRYNRENGMAEGGARAQMEKIWSPENFQYPNADRWAAFVRGEE